MTRASSSYYVYRTPHGAMTIGVKNDAVYAVALGEKQLAGQRMPTELSNRCANELLEYFAGKRMAFSVPTAPEGSAFQQAVWRAVGTIPYGQTRTNAEIAEAIGKPSAFRMVGSAVRKNPLAVLIPAHRVVGASGRTSGADASARLRAAFLELERRYA